MKRDTRPQFAASTAFAKSIGATDDASPQSVRLRIHRSWLAFVVGFPATTGALILWSGLSHEGADPTVVPIGLVLLAGSAALLVLGVRSYVRLEEGRLTSRFFGIRSTTVRLDQLVGATFAMLFPSISYVITIEDREGRKARVHANWWSNEQTLMNPLARGTRGRRCGDGPNNSPHCVEDPSDQTTQGSDRPSGLDLEGPHLVNGHLGPIRV